MNMDELDVSSPTPPSSVTTMFQEPQLLFGLILVFAWLIFMAVGLYLFHGMEEGALSAMERISALFTAALGFVWGFYFGTKNTQQLTRQLMSRIHDLEKLSR